MNSPIIDAGELAHRLARDERIVLADCRFDLAAPQAGVAAWRGAHLPGAHHLDMERDLAAPRGSTGGRHPVPDGAAFTALMRRIGVDTDTLLVAYDDGSHAGAARLWWLARYFGHAQVAVLNGGLAAWTRAGLSLDAREPPVASGNFTARVDAALRIDFEAVRAAAGTLLLVDARDARRYAGIEDPIDPRAGHIPGALNMPWQGGLGENGLLRDAAAQRERWGSLRGSARIPVMYCGSGVTACVNLLSIELAGIEGAKLYPGSWSDWCQHDGEVATGPGSA